MGQGSLSHQLAVQHDMDALLWLAWQLSCHKGLASHSPLPGFDTVELMQTSAKAAVFTSLPNGVKWQTLTSCCRGSNPKETVEKNIGDEKPISYAHLYKILFDHVSGLLLPMPAT